MQGYGSMAGEAAEQLREVEVNRPTHVFVQAGVGSLAGGVVGYFANLYPNKLEMANQESLVEIFRQSWQVLPVANQIQLDGIF